MHAPIKVSGVGGRQAKLGVILMLTLRNLFEYVLRHICLLVVVKCGWLVASR